jgi:hypothetical protein
MPGGVGRAVRNDRPYPIVFVPLCEFAESETTTKGRRRNSTDL